MMKRNRKTVYVLIIDTDLKYFRKRTIQPSGCPVPNLESALNTLLFSKYTTNTKNKDNLFYSFTSSFYSLSSTVKLPIYKICILRQRNVDESDYGIYY